MESQKLISAALVTVIGILTSPRSCGSLKHTQVPLETFVSEKDFINEKRYEEYASSAERYFRKEGKIFSGRNLMATYNKNPIKEEEFILKEEKKIYFLKSVIKKGNNFSKDIREKNEYEPVIKKTINRFTQSAQYVFSTQKKKRDSTK